MGKEIFETHKIGSTAVDKHVYHGGHAISDIFEITGERHYFEGDNIGRGKLAVEPITSFVARKTRIATNANTNARSDANTNARSKATSASACRETGSKTECQAKKFPV